MIALSDYILKALNPMKLSDADKKHLLKLDKEFGDLMELYRSDRNWKDPLNIDEEKIKFFENRKKSIRYYPVMKFERCKFTSDGILERMQNLLMEFERFDCFLSKYYIENLKNYIFRVKYTIQKITTNPKLTYLGNNGFDMQVSDDMYKLAMKAIKEHPYESIENIGRDIDAETAAKEIQAHINKRGYKWKIEMNDNMMPRMNVNTNKTMRIKTSAKFNEEDIEGLKAHEVDAHIGRRYYGYRTGLNLFIHGLNGRNILDEGLAVWNSLNLVDKPKKNIIFNTALKTIVIYNINIMDFCELFDYIKTLAPEFPDDKIFGVLVRAKREIHDMSLLGAWSDDASYFCGYQMVKDMTDKERDDILKYNIGPNQLHELNDIKRFLDINKFPPLI